MENKKRLSVIIVRPLLPSEKWDMTTRSALLSLGGAADEAVFPSVMQAIQIAGIKTKESEDFYLPYVPGSGMGMVPRDLAALTNFMLSSTSIEGDYVLLLDPAEICLDPLNIIRTLDYLDANTNIDVVSCEVKVYSEDVRELDLLVRTVMRPKIFRRSACLLEKIRLVGLLADDFTPNTGTNHLIAASGLTFRDTTGGGKERQEFELKLKNASYVPPKVEHVGNVLELVAKVETPQK
jgi:hypothetical protein